MINSQKVLMTEPTFFAAIVHSPGQWKAARTSGLSASVLSSPIVFCTLLHVPQLVHLSVPASGGGKWLAESHPAEAILHRAAGR